MTATNAQFLQRPLDRSRYLQVVRTALVARQFSFARQAILSWLATYPGDLKAGLYYARALLEEGHLKQAIQVLQGLCIADPESLEPLELLIDAIERKKERLDDDNYVKNNLEKVGENWDSGAGHLAALESTARAHWFALRGQGQKEPRFASWGGLLWFAREALEKGDLILSEQLIEEVLHQDQIHPLAGITHLRFLEVNPAGSLETRLEFARGYHERWPDTLYFILQFAGWALERGQSDLAVAMLHQAASRDVAGQVVKRIWGEDNPFRTLWPERLQLKLTLMMPAVVLANLGWNRLPAGITQPPTPTDEPTLQASIEQEIAPVQEAPTELEVDPELSIDQQSIPYPLAPEQTGLEEEIGLQDKVSASLPASKSNVELKAVEAEIERLAVKLNLAGITRQDGRFPIYVVFSIRKRLQAVYGEKVADLLESRMSQLVGAVRSRPGWGAMVFFGDDPDCTLPIGSKPVKPDDPWCLKLMLVDLDKALATRGERIGALLIVGGPEIVPFHHLPNPLDDQDHDVPSDNPYATRDKNYFIPEWPVGRLPGGASSDAHLLLDTLQHFQAQHASYRRQLPWYKRMIGWIREFMLNLQAANRRNFGYTAEIWRKAAGAVFRPIGKAGWMYVSPPSGAHSQKPGETAQAGRGLSGVPVPVGKLGYFNLHGLVDATEWFGHRDLLRRSDEPDYPIALRPQDIRAVDQKGHVPRVVFSEACYGMHIFGRSLDEAIALKFLEAGSLAIAGSTCMAYGSISAAPMVAADLLGYTFWRFLKQGMPAGEALRQSKIYLASEMHHRQGYLDGEDQKTLISFVLYGDPLAEPLKRGRVPKSIRYQSRPLADVQTVCDRTDLPINAGPVPVHVMDGVRVAVAKYLPGMSDARVAYVCEHEPHGAQHAAMSTSEVPEADPLQETKGRRERKSFRSLVMLSKQVARSGGIHPEIARLTLDEKGKLVKLVVSR